MNNIVTILVVLALFAYLIIRQFTEQRVNMVNLLLLPLLSAYACYTELPPAFARFAQLPLLAGLAVGVLTGLATGILRGRYTRVRLDNASGQIYSRPQLVSSLTWLALLLTHIGVIALSYSPLKDEPLVGILTAFASVLFLVSIAVQKLMVYLEYTRLQAGLPQQPYSLRNR
jgi:hypothetical protein